MIVKLLTEQHLKFLQKEAAQVRLSLHLSLVGNHMSTLVNVYVDLVVFTRIAGTS